MQLLDLPLDCFRYILSYVARDFDYHEHVHDFLCLRLTNRLMNAEVLRTLATPSFFKWRGNVRTLKTTTYFGAPWLSYPNPWERPLPLTCGYPEFVASYLYQKPHLQTPWNANFSSFLNRVVDALLSADGRDTNHESRKTIMRQLCCHVFEMKQWKRNWWWFSGRLLEQHSNSNPHLEMPTETESLEFNVLLANLLLGRRVALAEQNFTELKDRESCVFGTVLQTSIKSGQVDLVAALLDTGIDVKDISLRTLETAIECENHDMSRLLLSPKYNPRNSVAKPTRFQIATHQAIQSDRTEAVLFLGSMSSISDDRSGDEA
jgi:hypothetical protein